MGKDPSSPTYPNGALKSQRKKGAEERARRIVERWEADDYDANKDFLQDAGALLASLTPDGAGFRTLHDTVKRAAASLKKCARTRPALADDADEARTVLQAFERHAGSSKLRQRTHEEVMEKLSKLPESERLAIELHVFEGLGESAAAARLGLSVTAFRALFKRADEELKKRLSSR